jgi:predicted nucleic acid-binding protein
VRLPALYLDTSVLGGYFDDEWKEPTRELWRQMEAGQWRFQSSAITLDELTNAPGNVRELFRDTFDADALVEVTSEVEQLAAQYIEKGVIVPKYTDDARHVATCTVAKLDYLVSWNFRHLVNVQREAGFNAVNLLQGYQAVRIVNPLELIYGKHDQDI